MPTPSLVHGGDGMTRSTTIAEDSFRGSLVFIADEAEDLLGHSLRAACARIGERATGVSVQIQDLVIVVESLEAARTLNAGAGAVDELELAASVAWKALRSAARRRLIVVSIPRDDFALLVVGVEVAAKIR